MQPQVYLATLSNDLYLDSRRSLETSARYFGIDSIFSFDFADLISSEFYKQNETIMSNQKYMGYWLWKPYIISEMLKKMAENDILIYIDAGVRIIQRIDVLVDICANNSPIMVFGNANDINAHWTKRDAFVIMGCDEEKYWYSPHVDASLFIVRKCKSSLEFVEEWLSYGRDSRVITGAPNVCGLPNVDGFVEHRYDQSILALLAQKHKLDLYRMPSQFGNHYKVHELRIENEFNCLNQMNQEKLACYSNIPYYNSLYGQLLLHHRTKNKVDSINIIENNIDTERNYSKQSIGYLSTRIFSKLKTVFNKLL